MACRSYIGRRFRVPKLCAGNRIYKGADGGLVYEELQTLHDVKAVKPNAGLSVEDKIT